MFSNISCESQCSHWVVGGYLDFLRYNIMSPKFKLRYALFPTKLETGEWIWLKPFYERWFERGSQYDWEPERRRIDDPWVQKIGVKL